MYAPAEARGEGALLFRSKPTDVSSFQTQLDELRNRVGQLEEVNWEGRVQQLAALDKLLGRLNDRVRKRLERESSLQDPPQTTIDSREVSLYHPRRSIRGF